MDVGAVWRVARIMNGGEFHGEEQISEGCDLGESDQLKFH